jgi:hypothetical protein
VKEMAIASGPGWIVRERGAALVIEEAEESVAAMPGERLDAPRASDVHAANDRMVGPMAGGREIHGMDLAFQRSLDCVPAVAKSSTIRAPMR